MVNDNLLVLFPGALGDFICFLPTLAALRRRYGERLAVVAKPTNLTLLPPEFRVRISIDRREVADLFADGPLHTSTRHLFSGFARVLSWTGHGDAMFASRLANVTQAAVSLFHFRGMEPGEHASAYYARCAGISPAEPSVFVPADAQAWALNFWERLGSAPPLVLHAGSGSKRKNWEGMDALASRWDQSGGRVVLLVGPADHTPRTGPRTVTCSAPLSHVAALLRSAPLYLGNDSGISHLAAIVGTPSVVVFGPTNPAEWRPLALNTDVVSAPTECGQCGAGRFCTHRLSVDRVYASLLRISNTIRRVPSHPQ